MSGASEIPVNINSDFATILSNYPANTQLPRELQAELDRLNKPYLPAKPNTSCCMQICHAFNLSGIIVPSGNFRPEDPSRVASQIPSGSGRYYLLAVNEMINYLTAKFGAPLVLGKAQSAAKSHVDALTAPIQGMEGVLTFGNGHIELWNRYNYVQDSGAFVMDPSWVWSKSPVRFWRIGAGVAKRFSSIDVTRFQGWWDVNDGNQYYYYIDVKKATVWYTTSTPKSNIQGVGYNGKNSGDITITGAAQIIMDWDPADGGATRETFAFNFMLPTVMAGRSNRYGPLMARKMFV